MRSYFTSKFFAMFSVIVTFVSYFFDFFWDKNLFELIKDFQPDSLPLLLLPLLSISVLFFLYIERFKIARIILAVMFFPLLVAFLYIMIMLDADLIFKFIGIASYVLLVFLLVGFIFSHKSIKSNSLSV